METQLYLLTVVATLLFPPVFTSTKPHIVFILSDDLVNISFHNSKRTIKKHLIILCYITKGFNDVGFRGDTQLSTPNIDALAYSGSHLSH